MTKDEALKLALEALKWSKPREGAEITHNKAIAALEEVLAQPAQEPVAWAVYDILHGGSKTLHWPEQHSPNGDPKQYKAVPLYITPPQRKPLTDEEIKKLSDDCVGVRDETEFIRAIEQALKEKNT